MRSDFLRRIQSRGVVYLPPLSQRKEDIESLALFFLEQKNSNSNKKLKFSSKVISTLSRYDFDRFNVGELKGTVYQAYDNALFEGLSIVQLKHLNERILCAVDSASEGKDENSLDSEASRENEVLKILRITGFNMSKSEEKLGYAVGSKTITHHLRGIIYKSLYEANWDVKAAENKIAGPIKSEDIRKRIRGKIELFLSSVNKHCKKDAAKQLFIKLPQKYHTYLEELVSRFNK